MPHLILEHSKKLSLKIALKDLVEELHFSFAKQETVKLTAIKSRTISCDNVLLGDCKKSEFIFLKVLLLPGRTDALKHKFIEVFKEILNKYIDEDKCSFCIEICELQNYHTQ